VHPPGEVEGVGGRLGEQVPHQRALEQLVPVRHGGAAAVDEADDDATPARGRGGGPRGGVLLREQVPDDLTDADILSL
jgi:hypothetical protein